MIYLVDANVLCEPTRPQPEAKVVAWLVAHEAQLVVDSIVLGEIYFGIQALPLGRKRKQLDRWFDVVVRRMECLSWDAAVGLRWARLVADLKSKGRKMPLLDSMVAATALEHGLTVATHNTRDFTPSGVAVLDPFA